MAIDSARKRRAVASLGALWSGVGVTPDATQDQFWRQSVGYGYGGILAGESEPEPEPEPEPEVIRAVTRYAPAARRN